MKNIFKKWLTTSKTCYIIKLKLNKKHLLGGESVIREKLVAYRGKRSQKEMAKLYNVSQQAWNGWELGLYAPKPSIMKKIENDSGICMEELFFDVFNKQ